jgi:predicted nuclease of restriction endonuclease-like (RecB) superfamily
VDEKEFFIDLLFFNRRIQCLVAIELKRGWV